MLEFKFTRESIDRIAADLVFVVVFEKGGGEKPSFASLRKSDGGDTLDKTLDHVLSKTMREQLFAGKEGETLLFHTFGKIRPKYVLIVGAGSLKKFSNESLRRIGGKVTQIAGKIKASSLAAQIESQDIKGAKAEDRLRSFVEGCLLANYQFNQFKTKKEEKKPPLKTLMFQFKGKSNRLEGACLEGQIIAEGANFARDLTNLPPNILTPAQLGKEALGLAKKYKNISAKVFSPEEIRDQKMGALLAVAQGSKTPPAFIHLKYKPQAKSKNKIALVGKGITFDSGGLNIKQKDQELMKFDMAGSAAVLGIFKALGELKLKIAVEGFIPAAENMPAGNAYHPSDIIKTRSGKTVEIVNTDAEGRLALADALDFALESKPSYIIDMATLTGGAAYALGELWTPLLGNDRTLIHQLMAAGKKAGEPSWELPIIQDYKKGYLKGPADLKNAGSGTMASTISGAIFLQEFVKENKWAHMDIASTAWADEPTNYYTMVGATGNPVRTILYFLMHL